MKNILLALFSFVASVGQAQENVFRPFTVDTVDFVIEGTASEGADSVCLEERPYKQPQLFPVHNGRFRIVTRQPMYKFLQIEDKYDGFATVIVDDRPARVEVDFRTNKVVEGSPLNKRFNQYTLVEEGIEKEMELHENDADLCIYDSLERRLGEVGWKSVIENLDNVIPVYFLALNGQYCMISPEQLSECMGREYAFTHHPDMKRVWQFYREMQKRLPGQDFHDIELPDTVGNVRRLSEYIGRGRYVLLDFWASWCGPCLGSMSMMKKFAATYAGRGLQIIGISLDSDRGAWLSAIRRLNLPWVQLSDIKGWDSIGASVYGVCAIPETVIIDPNGKIVSTGLRGVDLENKLVEIFGK